MDLHRETSLAGACRSFECGMPGGGLFDLAPLETRFQEGQGQLVET